MLLNTIWKCADKPRNNQREREREGKRKIRGGKSWSLFCLNFRKWISWKKTDTSSEWLSEWNNNLLYTVQFVASRYTACQNVEYTHTCTHEYHTFGCCRWWWCEPLRSVYYTYTNTYASYTPYTRTRIENIWVERECMTNAKWIWLNFMGVCLVFLRLYAQLQPRDNRTEQNIPESNRAVRSCGVHSIQLGLCIQEMDK